MKHLKTKALYICCLLGSAIAQTSCEIIDDDLSDCGKDYKLVYRTRLVTNMDDELESVLADAADAPVREALRSRFEGVFTDYALDIDISFYPADATADAARRRHAQETMDGNRAEYAFYLPAEAYRNLAIANTRYEQRQGRGAVALTADTLATTAQLATTAAGITADTLESHSVGLFTARKDLAVPQSTDTVFEVPLYMANSALALVIDSATSEGRVRAFRTFAADMADRFTVSDSTYHFGHPDALWRTTVLSPAEGTKTAYWTVCFPSHDEPLTAAARRRPASRLEYDYTDGDTYWRLVCLALMADGTTTRTVLSIREPLRAAQLKIIKAWLLPDGSVRPNDNEIGTSVTLDWKEGLVFE